MSVEMNNVNVGAIVQSLAGRDKNGYFIVLEVDGKYAVIADGNKRKVQSPKRKKIKHLKKISSVSEELIEHIQSGNPIGNERLSQAIKIAKQKIQEN